MKQYKISVVIPVYNEADYLRECLESLDNQNYPAYEVIVVDNNSTDDSCKIVQEFPFVKLIREQKQGLVYARSRGYDQAQGEIIARTDADSRLPADWLNKINQAFNHYPDLAALSGSASYSDFYLFAKFARKLDLVIRKYLANKLTGYVFLFGANMAIRKTAWLKVRYQVCCLAGYHEDLDIAIHLQERNLKVKYIADLSADVSCRRIKTSFWQFLKYCLASPRTYKYHQLKNRKYMYLPIVLIVALFPLGYLIYASYNPKLKRLSVMFLLANFRLKQRIDPTILTD